MCIYIYIQYDTAKQLQQTYTKFSESRQQQWRLTPCWTWFHQAVQALEDMAAMAFKQSGGFHSHGVSSPMAFRNNMWGFCIFGIIMIGYDRDYWDIHGNTRGYRSYDNPGGFLSHRATLSHHSFSSKPLVIHAISHGLVNVPMFHITQLLGR